MIERKNGSTIQLYEMRTIWFTRLMRSHLALTGAAILVVTGAALLPLPVMAQRQAVTLDALHEFRARPRDPAPGDPAWAPDGKTFAYRQGGALKIYDIQTKQSRELLALSGINSSAVTPQASGPNLWENRRADEQDLQWNASSRELLYAANGDLFLIEARDGKWRQLTKTNTAERDPKFSPDGKRIAFYREWDLYTLDVASGKETRITSGGTETVRNGVLDWVYPEELQLGTAYWWSPDSQSIAYLQFDLSGVPQYPHADLKGSRALPEPQRYPQAGENNPSVKLGVVAATGGATKWLDVGDTVREYLIARVGWVPESKSVFVVRMNRVQNELRFLLFDKDSGASRMLYQYVDHVSWVNLEGDPLFLKNGREFLWTSEESGFHHLYRYSVVGGRPKELTKGNWQVTSLSCVDEAASRVYYVSTEASPLERQLYSVGLDGTGERRITREPGSHRISMSPKCETFLDTHSNLNQPAQATLRSADGVQLSVYRTPDRRAIEEFDLRPTEIIEFKGPSGATLYGSLIKPVGFDPGKKYPVIVNVYGGPHTQTVRNAWPGFTFDQVLAHQGFLVWQLDNRGSSGRGHAFESPLFRNLGPIELEDQVAGIRHLVSLGFADPNHVGITGWSYGGFMTLNALLNAPDTFQAGFAGAPVTNWLNYDTIYTERYMGLPQENASGYGSTSLVARAANLRGALKIVHNIEDDNVLFQNTMQMVNSLQTAGKTFEMMIYPGKSHGLTAASSRLVDRDMLEFFLRHLKPEPAR
jgi:dipeptidyl-peptidase 4